MQRSWVGWFWIMLLLTGCLAPATATPVPTLTQPSPSATAPSTATPQPTQTASPTRAPQTGRDSATFLSETYPDYAVVALGEQFLKTWELKNNGETTWYPDTYSLKLVSTPQHETLGSPAEIPLPQAVAPGEKVTLSIVLTAPTTPGIYAAYWSLMNERAQPFGVDGDRLWVLIRVCETGKTCSAPQMSGSTAANGVSASLSGFTPGPQSATAQFCLTLPNRNYGPSPAAVTLLIDGQAFLASAGSSLETGCFEFEFPVTETQISQVQTVAISIAQVRILGGVNDSQGACVNARASLMAQYPGLDFQCNFTAAGYYTALQLPTGMTASQADVIIVDTIEGAINGPWVLKVKG